MKRTAYCGKCSRHVTVKDKTRCEVCGKPIFELVAAVDQTPLKETHTALRKIALAAQKERAKR